MIFDEAAPSPDILASREMELRIAGGETRPVTIRVHRPTKIDDYWTCDFELIVADQPATHHSIPGTDSFDALY